MTPQQAVEFIIAHTAPAAIAAVPELSLYLTTQATDLWQQTQEFLDDRQIDLPYWAVAWPGGQALARLLLDQPGIIQGGLYDFGAGCGIAAIAAAKAGLAPIWVLEPDPLAQTALHLNMALNGTRYHGCDRVSVSADDLMTRGIGTIIAGDVFYDAAMSATILPILQSYADAGLLVLIADPGRSYRPDKTLLKSITAYDIPTDLAFEDTTKKRTIIYQLLPGGALAA